MGHVALYRQFRPITFDEIVEQKHAVAALRQSVISGQIGHAYLFCGTRGTGKTSVAKIFSRAINCLAPVNGNPCNECEICRGILDNTLMDVIEMDAASNNSVDNIRRVCDEVMFLPSRTKYKVYIIDEVHMLSGGAFNALLKTLEEPPAHAVFILATTEPHRIPATVISRCMRYDFRRIPTESMVLRLQEIADVQQTTIDPDALVTIANLSDGALRDGISLLDQVSTGVSRRITRDDVLRITGVVDDSFLYSMADALLAGDSPAIVTFTEQLVMDGRDMIRFTLDLAHYFRDLMVIRVTPDPGILVRATSESMAQMQELAGRTPADTLVYAVTRLSGLVSELKWSPDMRTSFEIALLSFGAKEHAAALPDRSTITPAGSIPKAPAAVPVSAPAAVPVSAPAMTPPAEVSVTIAVPVKSGNDTVRAEYSPADSCSDVSSSDVSELVPEVNIPEPVLPFMSEPASYVNKAVESGSSRNRSYMAPPPIEDMFISSPQPRTTPLLTPMEAALLPPPEEESYLVPPPFETPVPDSMVGESPDAAAAQTEDTKTVPQQSESQETISPAAKPPASASPVSSELPLSELWAALLHKWEDTMFSDALQLKQAVIFEKETVFHIVFPDNMRAYANSLTGRADYKKIIRDIMTVISGISSVEIQTESQRDGHGKPQYNEKTTAEASSSQPDWVAQMLAFSEATGIPVETLDNL